MEIMKQELTVDELARQISKVQQVMEKVMQEGEHYGVIPGTQKPTLLKSGAEKIAFTFRLSPEYDILPESERKDNMVSYVVRCTLRHIHTGAVWGQGLGSCNTNEKKYKYIWREAEKPESKEIAEEMKLKGTGRWQIVEKNGKKEWKWFVRIENDNPQDLDNTILKMACKRALVAAVLNATATSDIFTQDVEDIAIQEEQKKEPVEGKADEEKAKYQRQARAIMAEIKEKEGWDEKQAKSEWHTAIKDLYQAHSSAWFSVMIWENFIQFLNEAKQKGWEKTLNEWREK